MKAISAVITTIMLLMITVSLIGVFYVFSSTLATQTTSSGSTQASQFMSQLSMCMQVDNIYKNQITLRNCGKGVIENKSLVVMMDEIKLGASTQTIQEGNSSVVNVSGLWQIPFGTHSLKISNGAAVAQILVDVQPNKDGLVGSWSFDEGSGNKAVDSSGNGNTGTLTNMNTTGNATSGWTSGKYGSGLQFDGVNDYVLTASVPSMSQITVSAWVKETGVYGDIGGQYQSFMIGRVLSNGNLRIHMSTNCAATGEINYDGGYIVDVNQWTHISGTYDGTNYKGYVNGIQVFSTSGPQFCPQLSNFYIGGNNYGGRANGTIDEVHIWNKALAPDETVVMKQVI